MTLSITDNASQSTQVEQARAVTEVLASVRAAHDWPRDEDDALRRFLSACSRLKFAERAFWAFRRGGEQLTGPTIDFALEALRCWGNTISGTAELARRPGESEMLAYAWDLETNSWRRTTFFSPHTGYVDSPFDKQGNPKPVRHLIAVRDIRENNQSAGSRVEREMILAALPSWYVEEGIARCYATLAGESDKPIEDRRREAVGWYEKTFGVTRAQLVAKIGTPVSDWKPMDLARLRVLGQTITRGETSVAVEFDDESAPTTGGGTVTAADLTGAQAVDTPADPVVDASAETGAGAADQRVQSAIFARLNDLGMSGRTAAVRARRLRLLELITGETLASQNDLSTAAAAVARTALAEMTAEDVTRLFDEDERDRAADAAAGEQA